MQQTKPYVEPWMKTVLCYGDSLTWGYSAEMLARHAFADRWSSVLQAALGEGVNVIAEWEMQWQ